MSALEIMRARGVQQGRLETARKLRAEGADARLIKRVTGIDSKDLESKK